MATIDSEPMTDVKLNTCHHITLISQLSEHSAKWREIGTYLGFRGEELDIIAAKPNPYHEGPKGFLCEMFSEWLEWVPGDHRGSTKYPTLEILKTAISKSGL